MTTADADAPLLDVPYLDDMREWLGDEALAGLLATAPEQLESELAALAGHWRAGDLAAVRESGHRIKGAAGSVACRRLSALGHRVQLLDAFDEPLLADVTAAVAAATAALAEYRAGLVVPA
ncbi:MAG TPA: Hpt domain-containing protein [Candidatus Omnitrophota bacterium]|nr:Hpt domain-containing protein [Candidatus Omnitrophota bacterium]